MALALNEALADRWRKEVRTDGLGHPDFDASRWTPHASAGTPAPTATASASRCARRASTPTASSEALPELTEKINTRLAAGSPQDAAIRIDTPGPELTARRQWACELPEATVEIACGGTHLHRLGELASLTAELTLSEDGSEFVVVTTPKRA